MDNIIELIISANNIEFFPAVVKSLQFMLSYLIFLLIPYIVKTIFSFPKNTKMTDFCTFAYSFRDSSSSFSI